jgi:hypothetical protein
LAGATAIEHDFKVAGSFGGNDAFRQASSVIETSTQVIQKTG